MNFQRPYFTNREMGFFEKEGIMGKESKEHWSRHPLLVAIVSTCLFALVVGGLGSCFQHRNWKKQEEISRKKTHQEKLFDKRSEIAEKVFYLIKKRATNAYNMYSARNFPERMDYVKYWETRDEIICEASALDQQILIYFDLNTRARLQKHWSQINNIWFRLELKLSEYPESATKELIDQKSEETYKLEREIREIFSKILYSQEWGL